MSRPPTDLPETAKVLIREMHAAGLGAVSISRALAATGVTLGKAGVLAAYCRLGLEPHPAGRPRTVSGKVIEEACWLYREEGWSADRIARHVGLPKPTLIYWFRRSGVTMHRKGWRERWCVDCLLHGQRTETDGAKRCAEHRQWARAEEQRLRRSEPAEGFWI